MVTGDSEKNESFGTGKRRNKMDQVNYPVESTVK